MALWLFLLCVHFLVVIARDQMKNMGYEMEEFEVGRGGDTAALLRYDLKKAYYLRG